jgi:cytochrome c-type biogenesis protein CcmH/NrfG
MTAEAADCFEAAAQLDPDNTMVLFGLAATKAQQGDKQASIAILRRILEIDPDFTPAHQALGRLSP